MAEDCSNDRARVRAGARRDGPNDVRFSWARCRKQTLLEWGGGRRYLDGHDFSLPIMLRYGLDRGSQAAQRARLSTASGTLAQNIPPSMVLIV